MTRRTSTGTAELSITAVERDNGLSKDILRVWERRYGFPSPGRDRAGERVYSIEQLEKLRVVKRLLDAGHRPGRVVPLEMDELRRLVDARATARAPGGEVAESRPDLQGCVESLRQHDVAGLRRLLAQAQAGLGLGRFVGEVVAPLNTLVGEAWMHGQLQIFEEHAYTESIQIVLRGAIEGLPVAAALDRPRVLLSTVPGEPHGLGLLMVEAMLAVHGARCVSLGVQTPVWDLVLAAAAHRCDILALSFTACMAPNRIRAALTELRAKLPRKVEIWVGGTAPVLYRRPPMGVRAIADLFELHAELRRWRGQLPATVSRGAGASVPRG
jgi:MerR family transcriptional regulator, light-induced transcriptional regulator